MSETEECGNAGMRRMREYGWGVIILHTYGNTFEVTEYAAFYQENPRLKASGLNYDEAVAMCTLMNAGGNDGE